MADRYKVTVEEDNGVGIIGIVAAAVVIGVLLYILIWVAIPALIGYIIYLIVKYNKKQKRLEPTRCPRCRKAEALQFLKKEVIKTTPVTKSVQNKQTRRIESITMMEYTNRSYEKCKFCGEITFSDCVTSSI